MGLFFSSEQISNLLPMQKCIRVMKEVFLLDQEKDIVNPLRSKLVLPQQPVGILGMMPAYIKPYGIMGVKVLSVFPENYKKGVSSHQGILHLFETKTGKLLASFDADKITAIRTAAMSALATDLLSIDSASILCVLGSGTQAETHLEAITSVRNIEHVRVWSRNNENAVRLADQIKGQYKATFEVCKSVEAAITDADIICTVTASKTPILGSEYLKKSVHINAVGACTPDSRELTTDAVFDAKVFVDNHLAATNESGDLLIASEERNRNVKGLIHSDIHDLLVDSNQVKHKSKKTIFKSVGVAIEDLAAAYYCYKKFK